MAFTTLVEVATFSLMGSFAAGIAAADVVVIVSSTSAITTLSRAQVTDIFLGKVSRFPNGAPAVPIDQEEGSPARDEFYLTYAGKSQAQVKAHWSKIIFTGRGQPPRVAASGEEVKKRIAGDPAAIGYIEEKLVDASVRVIY